MHIVCAASMTSGEAAFRTLGDVSIVPEKEFTADRIRDADALAIRSKVRVTKALLDGTRVSFVGTATAGADHMDLDYLQHRGIAWCASPGCNANSVAEYIVAALLCLAVRHEFTLQGLRVAIVGVGHVGRQVREKLSALGMIPLLNDPPLFDSTGDASYRPLDEILPQADVVTLHVPLVEQGLHPTRSLAGPDFFRKLKPGCIFINASRGEVADSAAILEALDDGRIRHAVLDVFENEPECLKELLARADIITPHIAGHSFEGKLNGTAMVYEQLCNFLEVPPAWTPHIEHPPEALHVDAGDSEEDILWDVVRRVYDIEADDAALRQGVAREAAERGRLFEKLRGNYPIRHEFKRVPLLIAPAYRRAGARLSALGFKIRG